MSDPTFLKLGSSFGKEKKSAASGFNRLVHFD